MNEKSLTQQAEDYRRVEEAIRYLEANFRDQPSLDEIADSVHLSKYHFQRLFKRWAGVSPTQFLHYLTLEYAKQQLQESQSVLDASLDAGLSSPSRLHDLFVTFEAITPGEYRHQGAGLRITYGLHDTPFGRCLVATTPRGICGLYFVQEGGSAAALEQLQQAWPQAGFTKDSSQTEPLIRRIFDPGPGEGDRPFHLLVKGTNFQVKVWQALLEIPPGAMVSYSDVAAYLGNSTATRAAAGAIARNPVAYLIPCHRVISKTGKALQYQWGEARKKAMLGWEASRLHAPAGHQPDGSRQAV